MIISFKNDATRLIWSGEFAKNLPNQIQTVARQKLRMINAANKIEDLLIPPGNQLEACPVIELDNTVSELTGSGVYVLNG